ncbi:MAG: hypothetical protein JNK04_24315 [Myxococcales bacterium]|nr:hypothetical protein [Myxococcales bacterium]
MAAQGLRDVGDGVETVANPEEVEQLRQQARLVMLLTVASTIVATAVIIVASL